MRMEYSHTSLEEPVEFACGSFYKLEEGTLPYAGREVLYFKGTTSLLSTCCGTTSCGVPYLKVPGFVVRWQARTTYSGIPITEVEPIRDEATQRELANLLREKYGISNIDFW